MATASFMDYLAGDALTRIAQAYANKMGVMRPLPAEYYAGTNAPNVGVTLSYDLETSSREAAKVTNPDSPSTSVPGVTTVNKKVVGLGARGSYTIGLDLIQALQQPGDIVRMNAQMELDRQIRNFVTQFQTLRSHTVHSALFRGKIDVASTGDIQTSTSSPVRTIDYSVPTANKLTTDGSGSTYNIGDWSSASTTIVANVSKLKQYAAKTYNFGIDTVFYGPAVPEYLAKNTTFKEYLARNPQFNTNYTSTGEIPNGVMGLRWVPVATATSVTNGTATSWVADAFLAFMPSVSQDWYEVRDCGLPAPTGLTGEADFRNSLTSADLTSGFPVRYGLHSYAVMTTDPIGAKLIVADFHCPLIKSPNAYYFGVCA